MISLLLIGTFFIVACLFIAQPWFARKNVFFGVVFANDQVRNHPTAQKIMRRYLIESIGTALILLVLLIVARLFSSRELVLAIACNLIFFALLALETLLFIRGNTGMRRLKKQLQPNPQLSTNKISVAIGRNARENVLPLRWLLLLLPFFIATLVVACFGYPYMPDSIPVHFGLTGPDRWAAKSWLTVLNPVFFQLIFGALILFVRRAPASVKGNPNAAPGYAAYRKMLNLILILFCLATQSIFFLMVASPLLHVHYVWFLIIGVLDFGLMFAMFLIHARFVRRKTASGSILDDDDKWIGGIFYFNRSDPSLFIEKRVGIGYTVNMARPVVWIALALIVTSVVLFSLY
ncbi:DUF5808 domain-containing protein [Sporolactobacillus terrae]|uniref:DUF5808 domain-containing protein n=1 Tax=Sporolactobacillus terrae TaxID=269673 RepID=UPI00048B9385|nr:DUF5808 domain-containing protein [Sporolactobacillus terrae]